MRTKLMLLFLLSAAFSSAVIAQSGRGGGRAIDPEEFAKQRTETMVKVLSLSEEQHTKIAAINLKYAKEQQEKRQAAGSDFQAVRKQMNELNAKWNEDLKKELTKDQWAKWEKHLKDNQQRRPGGSGGK